MLAQGIAILGIAATEKNQVAAKSIRALFGKQVDAYEDWCWQEYQGEANYNLSHPAATTTRASRF